MKKMMQACLFSFLLLPMLGVLITGCPPPDEDEDSIRVPNVLGMTQADAEAAIEAAGLQVGTITEETRTSVPQGQVVHQNPNEGDEVAPGSEVNLVIAITPISAVYFPAEALADMAADLYETLAAGGDAVPIIRDLFNALGMYQDPAQSEHALFALIDEGYPLVLEDQVKAMANGFEQGFFIPLDSLVAQAEELGAYAKNPEGPLSVAHLSNGFAPLLELPELELEEVLPALVLYLGHERAAWLGGSVDPVWGDNDLDPVQFTLLLYGILMAGEEKADNSDLDYLVEALSYQPPQLKFNKWQGTLDPAGNYTRSRARNVITGFISDLLGIPLSKADAARAILCASTVLYSYQLELNLDGDAIWYRRPENPEVRQYWSDVIAELHFDFVPHNNASRMAIGVACLEPLPENGPVGGKPVTWSVGGALPEHGSLDIRDNATRSNGTARAIYYANEEKVPLLLRRETLWDIADGYVEVVVRDLLPQWSAIEAIVRRVRGVGIDRAYLTVSHYEFPELLLDFETYITMEPGDDSEVTGHFTANFLLDYFEDVGYYHGEGMLRYISGTYTPGNEDCSATVAPHEDGGINLYLYIEPEKTDLDVRLGFGPMPTERITLYCPENEPMTLPPTPMGWAGWAIAHFNITNPLNPPIPGPWHAGGQGSAIVASTTYTRTGNLEGSVGVAAVTMELRQR